MVTREDLHRLIDALPEAELAAVERYLARCLPDPLTGLLDEALEDDEPLTPEEDAAIAEGWEAYRRGETRPWREVRSELSGE